MRPTQQPALYPKPAIGWGRRILIAAISIYPTLLLILSLQYLLLPRRSGVLALAQVFAPYLFLPLLLLLPFAFIRGATLLRIVLIVCACIFWVRFGPRINLAQVQEDATAIHITAMSWNIRKGGQMEEVRALLKQKPADIVAIPEGGQWILKDEAVTQTYPYHFGGNLDLGGDYGTILLSAYPILERGVPAMGTAFRSLPRVVWARLDLGEDRTVAVVAAHPFPPGAESPPCTRPLSLCYEASLRDAQIAELRTFVSPLLREGEPLLLMGDFNVTDREPAYNDLASGLLDSHRVAGSGFGYTWRPARLMNREIPLLRIDYIFSSPNVTPLRSSTDCTPRGSDHCIVYGTFELE